MLVGATTGRAADLLRAVEAAERAVQLDPFSSRAHHALGSALNRLGRVDEARIAMQRAIEVDANSTSAMSDLSLYETTAGRLDQGVYWAMRMWPLLPNTPNSYYHVSIPLVFLDLDVAERWLAAAAARRLRRDAYSGSWNPLRAEARQLAEHGREKIGVLASQCLARRIPDIVTLTADVDAWIAARNRANVAVKWMFGIEQARLKLGHADPSHSDAARYAAA